MIYQILTAAMIKNAAQLSSEMFYDLKKYVNVKKAKQQIYATGRCWANLSGSHHQLSSFIINSAFA